MDLRDVQDRLEAMAVEKFLRMEWNYSHISADEEDLIIRLHKLLGDRWTLIARRLLWRTKEEIEKYWKLRSCSINSSERLID
ncbi:hypothetical protein SUGI_0151740 [Cryptomeria japonica]|nr:hypothetical protein SUGI_0151740 [Cryptomeria japonica]